MLLMLKKMARVSSVIIKTGRQLRNGNIKDGTLGPSKLPEIVFIGTALTQM